MAIYARIRYALGSFYWRLTKPITIGVKVLVEDENGAYLLVRQKYQSYWSLPGGGVESGESSRSAAVREVQEETGVRILPEDSKLFSVYFSKREYKSDHILLFVSKSAGRQVLESDFEIEEVAWFRAEELPKDVSPATKRRINEVRNGTEVPENW